MAVPQQLNQFIFELVAQIDDADAVLARYGVEKEEFVKLASDPQFQQQYREARKFWNSTSNVKERIAMKAAVALEDSLLTLFATANSPSAPHAARMDAIKQMSALARVDGGERAAIQAQQAGQGLGGGGPAVQISINLANATQPTEGAITIEASPVLSSNTEALTEDSLPVDAP